MEISTQIGDVDKTKINAKVMTITKRMDTNIAVIVGKKKKTVVVEKKKIFQSAVVHIITTRTKAMIVAAALKIKALITTALETITKTVITVGNNTNWVDRNIYLFVT